MANLLATDLYHTILAGDMRSATALVEKWANTHGYERAVSEILNRTSIESKKSGAHPRTAVWPRDMSLERSLITS